MFQWFSAKKIIFYAIMLSIPCLFLEGLTRVYFAYRVGPSVLLYGTPFSRNQKRFDPVGSMRREKRKNHSVNFHENIIGNYSKYHPNQKRVDRDEFGKTFRVTINSQGFRGKEFEQKKQPGVIRIVTLGASSTFGFHDRDNETYPFYLEEVLNAELPTVNARQHRQPHELIRAFEVINLGIPHLTTEMIYSLFIAEALELKPDIITFYEGMNDAWEIAHAFIEGTEAPTQFEQKLPLVKKIYNELRHRLLFVAAFDSKIISNLKNIDLSDPKYDIHLQDRKKTFVENIQRIQEECQKRGILFIVANQQAKSHLVAKSQMKGITYAQEKAIVQETWSTNGAPKARENFSNQRLRAMLYFLTHNVLMEELQNWVESDHVPFANVIRAMDLNRQHLLTWVHLTPQGNRIIATTFAEQILKQIRNGQISTIAGKT